VQTIVPDLGKLETFAGCVGLGFVAPDAGGFFTKEDEACCFVGNTAFDLAT
jgi:hypothetical protein